MLHELNAVAIPGNEDNQVKSSPKYNLCVITESEFHKHCDPSCCTVIFLGLEKKANIDQKFDIEKEKLPEQSAWFALDVSHLSLETLEKIHPMVSIS